MAEALISLGLFHLVFFRVFYFINPYCYATSELLEQCFPSSRLLGEKLRANQKVQDPYYYPHYTGLPMLSSYYPVHRLQAWLASYVKIDHQFIILVFTMLLHYYWASIGGYLLFGGGVVGLLAGITLGYLPYAIKQNSCIVYTCAWVPWLLLGAQTHNYCMLGFSMGAMLLAGYWPLAYYIIPFACLYWLCS